MSRTPALDAAAVPPERLRVLQVISKLEVGGLERMATQLTIALAGRVERIAVCTGGGAPFEPMLRAAGIDVSLMPKPLPVTPGRVLRAAFALARVVRRERPHVLHAHNPSAAIVAELARRLAGRGDAAIVSTYHGVDPAKLGRATRGIALLSDVVVGVGQRSTEALRAAGLPAARSTTVANAVSVERTRPAADVRRELGVDDAELVVSVGRYESEKNQALLLDAVALLAPARPRLRAVLVGGGPLAAELAAQAARLGVADRVLLAGERNDAVDIAGAADVFVITSTREELPLAVLEAMSLERPVVATNVGGIPDAVFDGETGLLVPSGDAQALAGALARVLDDPGLARSLGAAGRELVERSFSPAAMVDGYLQVYARAVEARRR